MARPGYERTLRYCEVLILLLVSGASQSIPKRVAPTPGPVWPDESGGPVFLITPEDSYVIRNKPATLLCKVAHALKVSFKCEGTPEIPPAPVETVFVDPRTGVRVVEVTLSIGRSTVDKSRDPKGLRCQCLAWNSRGEATSPSVNVSVASLRRHFVESPYSRSVEFESQLELRCLPPEGQPTPTTTWLKNGVPIDFKLHTNYRVSSEGSLLVLSANPRDSANFTCVAENAAGRRVSDMASLKVYVDGAWSSWSSWSACNVPCDRGFRKRTRTCTDPEPASGGAACQGPALQKADCSSPCSVDGIWSSWSEWSVCTVDCRNFRQRSCSNSQDGAKRSCVGKSLQENDCTGGLCQKEILIYRSGKSHTALQAALRQDITLIVALSVVVPLFLILSILVLKRYNLKNRSQGHPYEATNSDYPLMSRCKRGRQKRFLSDTTVLKPSSSLPLCLDLNGGRKSLVALFPPNDQRASKDKFSTHEAENIKMKPIKEGRIQSVPEHFYDVPLMQSPPNGKQSNPSDILCLSIPPPIPKNPPQVTPINDNSPATPESAVRAKDWNLEVSPTIATSHSSIGDTNTSSDQSISPEMRGVKLEALAKGVISSSGGRLVIPNYNIFLTVPPGALTTSQTLYVAVISSNTNFMPSITKCQTMISPIVCCGPSSVHLNKPAVLSFEHCGSLQHAGWRLHLFSNIKATNSWEKLITLGEEQIDTPVYTQIDGNQVHLMTETLQQYSLVGESAPESEAVKQLRVAVLASPTSVGGELTVGIHIVQNTTAAIACVSQKGNGCSLLDKPRIFLMHDSGANISIMVDDVDSAWNLQSGIHCQEVSFEAVWNSRKEAETATFVFQKRESRSFQPLSCRVLVQQKTSTIHRQIIRINTDFPYAPVTLSQPIKESTATWKDGGRSLVSVTPGPGVFRLSTRARRDLSRCLDSPTSKGNDWRMLAAKLNVDRYLNYFATMNRPTEHILDLWEVRHKEPTAITDLLNILRVMERPDAAHVLENHSQAWL